jgi:hypothetical protein
VDFANARLVLAPQPTAGDLAAAADIAARLGFETSAMDLPMVRLKPDATTASDARPLPWRPASAGPPRPFTSASSRSAESGTTVDALAAGAPLKAGDGLIAAFSTGASRRWPSSAATTAV